MLIPSTALTAPTRGRTMPPRVTGKCGTRSVTFSRTSPADWPPLPPSAACGVCVCSLMLRLRPARSFLNAALRHRFLDIVGDLARREQAPLLGPLRGAQTAGHQVPGVFPLIPLAHLGLAAPAAEVAVTSA